MSSGMLKAFPFIMLSGTTSLLTSYDEVITKNAEIQINALQRNLWLWC